MFWLCAHAGEELVNEPESPVLGQGHFKGEVGQRGGIMESRGGKQQRLKVEKLH